MANETGDLVDNARKIVQFWPVIGIPAGVGLFVVLFLQGQTIREQSELLEKDVAALHGQVVESKADDHDGRRAKATAQAKVAPGGKTAPVSLGGAIEDAMSGKPAAGAGRAGAGARKAGADGADGAGGAGGAGPKAGARTARSDDAAARTAGGAKRAGGGGGAGAGGAGGHAKGAKAARRPEGAAATPPAADEPLTP